MSIKDRITHAWNALSGNSSYTQDVGVGYGSPPHKIATPRVTPSSYASTVFNRIAVDASMVDVLHVKIDKVSQNESQVESGMNNCLQVEANIDQSNRDFLQDVVYSMFDEGVVAIVPVETTINPENSGSYDVSTLRVGKIVQWYPQHVRVLLYNELTGLDQEVTLPKRNVAIVENPLFPIINGKNSTLKRLVSKLALLDMSDEVASAGKLDLIIQLPYVVKTPLKRKEAEQRIRDLEAQLATNKFGIAYTDGTESITQLNRQVSNTLVDQVKYLTQELYNQLGLTANVFNGTASESEMRTYYNRTIDPILARITAEFGRKFLTKTARTQGHKFTYRRDPFKLVPVEQLAAIADTFSRNELLTPNEIRPIIGFGPSNDPEADKLSNRNIADKNKQRGQQNTGSAEPPENNLSNSAGTEAE